MSSRQLAVAIAALILQLLPTFADNVITNIMSPVVSYQYYDSLGEDTNSQIISFGVSYQYFDWPGNDVLNSKSSPLVSYYYPLLDTPPLKIIPTNRTPTAAETTLVLAALPTSLQLLAYHGGVFTTNLTSIDPSKMTIVLTHGWGSDPNAWGTNLAAVLSAYLSNPKPNIVAWDWSLVAKSAVYDPGIPAAQTGDQGRSLGAMLLRTLGANYSKPIHFIGHSLGTLVNASAANYLHGDRWAQEDVSPAPWAGTNTQMTLFDEAEAATGKSGFFQAIATILDMNGNPLSRKTSYYHPLPKQFAWSDNFVSAFGLLHPESVNVILTNGFPTDAANLTALVSELAAFHGYPINWYDETIQTDISTMGFLWSFERGGWFSQAPGAGSVYVQGSSEWNLSATDWNYGTNFLAARFQAYRNSLAYALTGETPNSVAVNGNGLGESAFDIFVMFLFAGPANSSPAPQIRQHSFGISANDENTGTTTPACAWIPLVVPTSAVSMSFDYKIQGDWRGDTLAAAFNGTNVLSLPGSQIETNVLFNSGAIDVSAFGGHTNELFIGIIGSSSTNAQLVLQNISFYSPEPPFLLAQLSGRSYVLTWPLSTSDWQLEATVNLTTNSWVIVTNIATIVNFQNTVTDEISGASRYYRLKIQ